MCQAQGWKSTGKKPQLIKRVAKKVRVASRDREAIVARVEDKIGPKQVADGIASQIRRYYTDHYGALDSFDRLWYELRFRDHPRDWQSHFCWSLLHVAVINARAVWCAAHRQRVPLRTFVASLITCFISANDS